MIIFTPIRYIPEEPLINNGIKQLITYNLTSYFSDVPTLNMLIPSNILDENILDGDTSAFPKFDIEYGNAIMGNQEAFLQFMDIVIPIYMNPDTVVQILIGMDSDYRNNIAESLAKLIQQRYGYDSIFAYEIEDFFYLNNSSSFSIPGLFVLDKDLERWRVVSPRGSEIYDGCME